MPRSRYTTAGVPEGIPREPTIGTPKMQGPLFYPFVFGEFVFKEQSLFRFPVLKMKYFLLIFLFFYFIN